MESYVITYPSGGYVALDQRTHGYPYMTTDWRQAEFWESESEAGRFLSGIGLEGFKIAKLTVTITEVIGLKS